MNPPLLTTAETIDPVFWYILGVCIFFLLLITVVMLYFVWKYHRSRHPYTTSQVSKNVPLEIVWTLVPTLLALSMFWYGWAGYLTLQRVPEGAMVVDVTGRMWSWLFEYGNGKTSDRLYVPAGQPVQVNIHSADVIHSFYIPAFRVKKDAVPGMTTYVWFVADRPGSYDIFCAEYCGTAHSAMITTVEALPPEEFLAWYEGEGPAEADGELKALLTRHGCLGCHSLDGSPGVGPTLQGIFGRQVTVLVDGQERTLTADRDYLRRSILEPQVEMVKGYPPVMPSYRDRIPEAELEEMLDLFERPASAAAPSGEKLAQDKGCIGCHSTDGSRQVGPTFQGVFGRQVTVERNGQPVTIEADEDYLRRAIVEPQAEIVQGYPPSMPPYSELSDEELAALIDYLRGL
ncbi:MAG: cytochrome c oxidase subunit II [Desulfuromonadales bacterium]|nr:cytochrome c oxidase subunit II [Desulfuromonadales bacterium]